MRPIFRALWAPLFTEIGVHGKQSAQSVRISSRQPQKVLSSWAPKIPKTQEQQRTRLSKLWLLVLLSKTEPARVCSTKRKMSERAEKQITSFMACGTAIMADVHFTFLLIYSLF